MMQQAVPAQKFEALDGLRGIFALTVALYHLKMAGHFYGFEPLRNSAFAVDFFFLLSGFVITHSSFGKLASARQGFVFALRRLGRVWPLHLFVLGLFVLQELVKLAVTLRLDTPVNNPPFGAMTDNSLASLPFQFTLTHSLGFLDKLTWNYPSWSISTEFYTYLIFAACVVLLRRFFVPLALLLVLACPLVLFLFKGELEATYDFGLIRCVFGFFLGSLAYLAFRKTKAPLAVSRPLATGLEVACIALFLLSTFLAGSAWSLLVPFAFVLPLWVFACHKGAISSFLSSKPLQKLGQWSYGIYMVHAFILVIGYRVLDVAEKLLDKKLERAIPNEDGTSFKLIDLGNPWLMDGVAILYLLAVIIAAALSYRFVEQPGQRFFNHLATKWFGATPSKKLESPAP